MSVREPLALDLIKSETCVFCAGPVNGNKDLVRRGLRELKAVGELF